jgi:predicted O-methyltransferase YrrM
MKLKTKAKYDAIFRDECLKTYPEIDALEKELDFAVDKDRLEAAARVLACPMKVNPPSWQHGRVIYSLLCDKLTRDKAPGIVVDIGTAKGFSAVVMGWAIEDTGTTDVEVVSVDVVAPQDATLRNSVAELDRALSVYEFVDPFISRAVTTTFFGNGSGILLDKLYAQRRRVPFAFVDGKHTLLAVSQDAMYLSRLQVPLDVVVFDDIQIPGVADGARVASQWYAQRFLRAGPSRTYAVGVRR